MKSELFVDNNELISKKGWESRISAIKADVGDVYNSIEECEKEVEKALVEAVRIRIPQEEKEKFGILFSGGVDSTVLAYLCKMLGGRFVCYSVGTEESKDIRVVKDVAEKFGFDLKIKILDLRSVEAVIKETVKIVGKDIVSVGVGSVEVAALKMAAEDNIKVLFGGLGSEEIFAGYDRHMKASNVNDECWRGLFGMWERDLIRDNAIAKMFGVEFRTPFLDENLIKTAMRVPEKFKITKTAFKCEVSNQDENKLTGYLIGKDKKWILRKVAEQWIKGYAWRKRIAAQYGSGIDRMIKRLAKKEGFRYKKGYLDSLS